MTTPADIAARAALELGLPPDDERVTAAVDAAIGRATVYVYGTTPTPTPYALPLDDPSVAAGLVDLAVSIHLKPRAPTGDIGSDVYPGVTMPADPLDGCHAAFDHLRTADAHGIA